MGEVNGRREGRALESDSEPLAQVQGAQAFAKNGGIPGLFRADPRAESGFAQLVLAEGAGFELSVRTVVERRGSPECSLDRQMVDILSAVLTDTVELFVSQSPARQGGKKTGNGAQLVIKERREVVIGIKVLRGQCG